MRRKFYRGVCVLSMVTMLGASLSGCKASTTAKEEASTASATVEKTTQAQKEYKVTFYDSDQKTVLEQKKVKVDAIVDAVHPTKQGYTFVGWYATPNLSRKFDFTTKITQDTSLYAGFSAYQEDTRNFIIVGSGKSPVLTESNWGAVANEAETMTKEQKTDENVYTITLDLQAGDQFQFAANTAWEDQRGFGYLDTVQKDNTQYFKSAAGLGSSNAKRTNIEVEVAGNYTFTLTTNPTSDTYDTSDAKYKEESKENFNINPYDSITWTYNGQ